MAQENAHAYVHVFVNKRNLLLFLAKKGFEASFYYNDEQFIELSLDTKKYKLRQTERLGFNFDLDQRWNPMVVVSRYPETKEKDSKDDKVCLEYVSVYVNKDNFYLLLEELPFDASLGINEDQFIELSLDPVAYNLSNFSDVLPSHVAIIRRMK